MTIGAVSAETAGQETQPTRRSRLLQEARQQESSPDGLTPEEQRRVAELAKIDRAVRAHEQAHLIAAGPYATGGASFSYVVGPDGRRYAVGGEVGIDTSSVPGDPEATIRKARAIQAAANAPADPSAQDRQVAAAAAQMERAARLELALQEQQQAESRGKTLKAFAETGQHAETGERLSLTV